MCRKIKSETEFHVNRNKSSGRQTRCKACRRKIQGSKRFHPGWADQTGLDLTKERRCGKCRKVKPLTLFPAQRKRAKPHSSCKECHHGVMAKRKYGVTLQELFEVSGSDRCECCKIKSAVCIDHNHKTGKVRGALCMGCNTMIGYIEKNPKRIVAGIRYIKKYQ